MRLNLRRGTRLAVICLASALSATMVAAPAYQPAPTPPAPNYPVQPAGYNAPSPPQYPARPAAANPYTNAQPAAAQPQYRQPATQPQYPGAYPRPAGQPAAAPGSIQRIQ